MGVFFRLTLRGFSCCFFFYRLYRGYYGNIGSYSLNIRWIEIMFLKYYLEKNCFKLGVFNFFFILVKYKFLGWFVWVVNDILNNIRFYSKKVYYNIIMFFFLC